MSRGLVGVSGLWLGCLLMAGCSGGGDADRQPTRPVSVKISYRGAPVAGATVTFVRPGEQTRPAVGLTDDKGVAQMKTYEEGDGAVVGSHQVFVIKSQITNAQPQADVDSDDYVPPPPGGLPPAEVKNLIPAKYASPATSGLTAEVAEGDGALELTFELQDK